MPKYLHKIKKITNQLYWTKNPQYKHKVSVFGKIITEKYIYIYYIYVMCQPFPSLQWQRVHQHGSTLQSSDSKQQQRQSISLVLKVTKHW